MVYVTPPTSPVSPTSAAEQVTVTPFAARRKAATVTVAVTLADPEVAVIVAVPSATDATAPDEETVATDAADDDHDTLAPLIVAPFWSLTAAESCWVAPKDEKLRVVADNVTDVATGLGGVGVVGGLVGVVPPSPHARSKSTAASRM